jgi:hypothetical protein
MAFCDLGNDLRDSFRKPQVLQHHGTNHYKYCYPNHTNYEFAVVVVVAVAETVNAMGVSLTNERLQVWQSLDATLLIVTP